MMELSERKGKNRGQGNYIPASNSRDLPQHRYTVNPNEPNAMHYLASNAWIIRLKPAASHVRTSVCNEFPGKRKSQLDARRR